MAKNRIPLSKTQTTPKSFSSPRPWGVKTLYLGSLAKEYRRLTNSATSAVALKLPKRLELRRG